MPTESPEQRVHDAADTIAAEGDTPTVDAVRQRASISMAAASKHLATWRAKQQAATGDPVPELARKRLDSIWRDLRDAFQETCNADLQKASEIATRASEREQEAIAQHLATQKQAAVAEQGLIDAQQKLTKLANDKTALEHDKMTLERSNIELTGKLAALEPLAAEATTLRSERDAAVAEQARLEGVIEGLREALHTRGGNHGE